MSRDLGKFQKYLGDLFVGGKGVAQYTDGSGNIVLAVQSPTGTSVGLTHTFTPKQYQEFLAENTEEGYVRTNDAATVLRLINILQ